MLLLAPLRVRQASSSQGLGKSLSEIEDARPVAFAFGYLLVADRLRGWRRPLLT